MINNLKIFETWKIQLTIAINFRDTNEEHVMHWKSGNIEFMICDNAGEVIEKLLNDFLIDIKLDWKYQWEVVVLSLILFIYCIINVIKKNPNRGGSYIDSPDWKKNKKRTLNSINKIEIKCFQYIVTIALNYEKLEKNTERTLNIKPFIAKYYWEELNHPFEKDDWEIWEK